MSIDIKKLHRAAIDPKRNPYPGHTRVGPEGAIVTDGRLLVYRGPTPDISAVRALLANDAASIGSMPSPDSIRSKLRVSPHGETVIVNVSYDDPVDPVCAAWANNERRVAILDAEERVAVYTGAYDSAPRGQRSSARSYLEAAKAALKDVHTRDYLGAHVWSFVMTTGDTVYVDRDVARRAMRALGVRKADVTLHGTHDPIVIHTANGFALVMPCIF